jgi:hypothetical protein
MIQVDAEELRKLKAVAVLRAKLSQLNSLNLLVSDDSFRNWDSQFQNDISALVNSLGKEVATLVFLQLRKRMLLV